MSESKLLKRIKDSTMTTLRCVEKIDKYLADGNHYPLIVNFSNINDLNETISHYSSRKDINYLSVTEYCRNDMNPQFDKLYNDLLSNKKIVFLCDYMFSLRFLGTKVIANEIKKIINLSNNGKVVVFALGCESYLKFSDPKVKRRIAFVNSTDNTDYLPTIVFTKEDVPNSEVFVDGINNLFPILRTENSKIIYVATAKTAKSYAESIYKIDDMKTAYRFICHKYPVFSKVNEDYFEESQWEGLKSQLDPYNSFEDYLNHGFGDYKNLDKFILNWPTYSQQEKQIYVLGLKLYYSGDNWCIKYAKQCATNADDFVQMLYRSVDVLDYQSKDYEQKYYERKDIIKQLGNTDTEAHNFCNYIGYKGIEAIYYLTDLTQIEKEKIINILSEIGSSKSLEELKTILKVVYKGLYDYLNDFSLKNDFLNNYFQNYKYQKVINMILPEFKEIVEKQAIDRDFNILLQPRTSAIDSLNKTNSELVFFDALGVEFLAYIQARCREIGLSTFTQIYRCELPSLTSYNKEFVEVFQNAGIPKIDIKDLDEIKHKGKLDYLYNRVRTPIHLVKELEIINEVLLRIKSKLENSNIKKVFVISDHGATRLAVINENILKIDAYSKGEHGGRLCEINNDVDESKIPQATKADDKLVLANYDMFAGAKRASVEVHGGATLEEITVPIIEIELRDNSIKHEIKVKNSPMALQPNVRPVLEFYSVHKIGNVTIKLKDKLYDAIADDYQNYSVELPILKSGDYSFDVYSNNNLIAADITFRIEGALKNTDDFMSNFDF